MSAEGVRHVAVVDGGVVIGVVSARDVLPILTSHVRSTA
jgi:CBS domain-containing protein